MALLSLIAKLGLDKTGFDAGLSSANRQAVAFGGSMKAAIAGAFSVAAVAAFARKTIEALSQVSDLSKAIGISTVAIQEFKFAAEQSGQSIEDIARAFKALSKARQEAIGDPSSKAGQAFGAVGISSQELKSQSLEQTFRRIADVFKTTDFGASEIAVATELLGRAGNELIPVFIAGLETAGAKARELGLIVSDDVVQNVDEAGDAIDRIIARFTGPMASAIGFIADIIRDMMDAIQIGIGGLATALGEFSVNKDFGKAKAAWVAHVDDILERRLKEDELRRIRAEQGIAQINQPARERREFNFDRPGEDRASAVVSSRAPTIQSDQFQRIGAFTGAAAEAAQVELLRRNLTALEKIRDDLIRRGIKVDTSK